ncbi:sigma-70 family RNA polymerase sigma factor [Aureliella helgolandensis]|uniref:ECF RNA polymerase sigma-E factor n=1 Tax=Aureliella helgolandensis TaxID=2527968 RepID=A0A518G410_9BACT|nr:sigma-70 family RNA polymerase sigma factor [Aureliella helgolandensis]QDV23334.1 ECF RNA polymerase sigma-E factor [Aureliella helgolandensis]
MIAANSSHSTGRFSQDTRGEDFLPLLAEARSGNTVALGQLLQWYINYLTVLASTGLDRRLQRRVSPSDLVQEAMLAAHRDFGDFRGQSQGELLCWLRQILVNTLHRAVARHVKAGKRDIRREVSIDQVTKQLEESTCTLAKLLPAHGDSPSAAIRAREDAVDLANQLSGLRPQYRDVIIFRVLQGLSFEEIGKRMERSPGATRMLWLRALQAFKPQLEPKDDEAPS